MDWNVVIVHAEGEEYYAEKLAAPMRKAGYTVHHGGLVLVGESITEQTARALSTGGPVVLCGTVKAAGTRWPQWLVDVVRTAPGPRRLFTARLEAAAYIERLVPDDCVIADCCSDSISTRGSESSFKLSKSTIPSKVLSRTQLVLRENRQPLWTV